MRQQGDLNLPLIKMDKGRVEDKTEDAAHQFNCSATDFSKLMHEKLDRPEYYLEMNDGDDFGNGSGDSPVKKKKSLLDFFSRRKSR